MVSSMCARGEGNGGCGFLGGGLWLEGVCGQGGVVGTFLSITYLSTCGVVLGRWGGMFADGDCEIGVQW